MVFSRMWKKDKCCELLLMELVVGITPYARKEGRNTQAYLNHGKKALIEVTTDGKHSRPVGK
jgi:hypothetical protein